MCFCLMICVPHTNRNSASNSVEFHEHVMLPKDPYDANTKGNMYTTSVMIAGERQMKKDNVQGVNELSHGQMKQGWTRAEVSKGWSIGEKNR